MSVISIDYIDVDEKGVARIRGKRSKVAQIIMDKKFRGWGPDEIHLQYPHLSLAEIYAAFSYYYDHQQKIDKQIEESICLAEETQTKSEESEIVKKLKALGKIR